MRRNAYNVESTNFFVANRGSELVFLAVMSKDGLSHK
jgi:hypothetical protein